MTLGEFPQTTDFHFEDPLTEADGDSNSLE